MTGGRNINFCKGVLYFSERLLLDPVETLFAYVKSESNITVGHSFIELAFLKVGKLCTGWC